MEIWVYVMDGAIALALIGGIWAMNRAAKRARPLTPEEDEQARIESQAFSL